MEDSQDIVKKLEELKKDYKKLTESEELYRTALGLTTHTVTIVDIPNRALCQIFNEGSWSGVETTMTDAPESIIKTGIIYPDDEEGYREFYREIYAGVPKTECPIRVLGENGHWYWFTMYAETIFDEKGLPLYAVCFSDDLTSRHEAELFYNQFTDIIISQAEYYWEVNLTKDSIIRNKDEANTLVQLPEGNTYSELHSIGLTHVYQEDRTRFAETFNRVELLKQFHEGHREIKMLYRYSAQLNDEMEWMESNVYLMMNADSDITALITTKHIDSRMQKEIQMEERAEHDPLCGLMNREAWEQVVRTDMETGNRGVLFMIDADDFKNINDKYGHIAGDKALVSIANTIKQNFRKYDYVARFGGDEFVVYMRGDFNKTVIEACAESLIKRIKKIQMDINPPVSISVGIACWNGLESLTELYERADRQLYNAKNGGKGTFAFD